MSPLSISRGGTPAADESFTQMANEDLESIGRHCQFEYCGQLDFLPFRCESCRSTYCLDHRSEIAHKCPRAGEWARRRAANNQENRTPTVKPNIYNSDQCYEHRLREEHDCAKLTPLGARQGNGSTPNETIKSMFARVRGWGKEKQAAGASLLPKTKPKPNSPAARAVEVNTMKRTAKGEAGVPADKRLYLHTVGTADTQAAEPPSGDFYYDERWKVGRVLDDVAKRLRVENLNNRSGGEEARLRIFHVESGEFLDFSDSISGKVKSGDTIVLLRGAGVILENS
ncbi:uncharacterized protein N7483_005629 [Penicillium malachiteum]|uniref:uncharacterized protein n=1 Tax=Penicillium malachiteum TaxID=1324776 RepID=UPI002547C2FD|nr:uncharacterized protein N7483_005629 [Penicillium malachiteum]KAJ5731121.1 hypothetical protein N7483_005629 [Penicillium malachiteum]